MKDTKKAISISGTHFEDVNENYWVFPLSLFQLQFLLGDDDRIPVLRYRIERQILEKDTVQMN